jgi:hypothetical protein
MPAIDTQIIEEKTQKSLDKHYEVWYDGSGSNGFDLPGEPSGRGLVAPVTIRDVAGYAGVGVGTVSWRRSNRLITPLTPSPADSRSAKR